MFEQRKILPGDYDTRAFNTPEKIKALKYIARQMIEKILREKPIALVFLDRAARPISWIIIEAWKKMCPGKKLPPIKYIDIGQVKRKLGQEPPEAGEENVSFFNAYPGLDNYFNKNEWHERSINSEKTKKVWQRLNADDVLLKMMPDFYGAKGEVMIIDDYPGSGRTAALAEDFLKFNFPDLNFHSCTFFSEMDTLVFNRKNWIGTALPWNVEKEYTLMAGNEADEENSILAKPEKDIEKRKKGLALKQEIKEIFKDF